MSDELVIGYDAEDYDPIHIVCHDCTDEVVTRMPAENAKDGARRHGLKHGHKVSVANLEAGEVLL